MNDIKKIVREGYAKIAAQENGCCRSAKSCCGGQDAAIEHGKSIGYSDKDLKSAPQGANLGLGCGNPVALASLKEAEIVLDLGSGAGFDCFLAAGKVGKTGRVIGVDMTPEMVDKARKNAKDYPNVEFRLGEIENLPVADNFVDVVISNCVINLSIDKKRVFAEAYRVLKPGGRLMVSDIVLLRQLPDAVKDSIDAYVGCLAGAMLKDDYLNSIVAAGFEDVKVMQETPFAIESVINDPALKTIIEKSSMEPKELKAVANSIRSINVCGAKMK